MSDQALPAVADALHARPRDLEPDEVWEPRASRAGVGIAEPASLPPPAGGADPREVARLVEHYRDTGDRRYRNRVVEHHLHLAEYFVRRFANRGVPLEDLRQVALLSIVRAVDRFDPGLEVTFATFAGRTVEGELKRYFRDRTWSVRPPRRTQELHLELRSARERLAQRLGRVPTVKELAVELEVGQDHVIEAMEASAAHRAASLDAPAPSPGDGSEPDTASQQLAEIERGYLSVDARIVVQDLLDRLPPRERTVIELRFFEGLSQPEIAERIGVSQSYLSRIIRRTLVDLRARMGEV